ncbi:hypothetical protein EVA_09763 [gut metagenome]|uniref:Uncharacterized protein n=1 Tax=gut metagenome TaxID=749906 RepID=J9CPU2_9ZZZZ
MILCPTPLPKLNDPAGIRMSGKHGLGYFLVSGRYVDTTGIGSLMEGVHTVIFRIAHDAVKHFIVTCCHFTKSFTVRVKDIRANKGAPFSLVVGLHPCFLGKVTRHHTAVTRQYRLHAKFTHTIANLFCQSSLPLIPPYGIGTAPSFHVVHSPPSLETRTSNKLVGFFVTVTIIFCKQFIPYSIESYDLQRQVNAMQGHPVNFLLPTFPSPYRHRIGKGAIVQIIAIIGIGLMSLLLFRNWKLTTLHVGSQTIP